MDNSKNYKIYAENLDPAAMEQFTSAMEQPYVRQGALMPDAHKGYTLPIGAVVSTKDFIVPSWVGYDIGCGVGARKLDLKGSQLKGFEEDIAAEIYNLIPVGNSRHQEAVRYPMLSALTTKGKSIAEERGALFQLGTLGGGNHFLEVGTDENDDVWVIVHSGSRGTGHGIAGHYMQLAAGEGNPLEGHNGFHIGSTEGKEYMFDQAFCLQYAIENRSRMIASATQAIQEVLGGVVLYTAEYINKNHNHVELSHDGLYVHRKGATQAEHGMMGVIPGNMRDGSFIVRGKGSYDSIMSSSHGAGRVLGRYKAKKVLSVDEFESTMDGIVAKVGQSTLDESPMAYKDIFEVMRLQSSLVEVVNHVTPLINIKE